MVEQFDAGGLLRLFRELGEQVAKVATTDGAFAGITSVALTRVSGTAFASITRGRGDHFQTVAPTIPAASEADRLQYELVSGPCVDSVAGSPFFVSDDIGVDARWPVFGPRVADRFGVAGMLSVRIVVDADIVASLNLYSRRRFAFPAAAQEVAMLLAVHAGVILAGVVARERVEHMEVALASSRRIGMAIGIIRSAHRVSSEQAFDLLRIVSQKTNRRVSLIAERVVETGEFDPG